MAILVPFYEGGTPKQCSTFEGVIDRDINLAPKNLLTKGNDERKSWQNLTLDDKHVDRMQCTVHA